MGKHRKQWARHKKRPGSLSTLCDRGDNRTQRPCVKECIDRSRLVFIRNKPGREGGWVLRGCMSEGQNKELPQQYYNNRRHEQERQNKKENNGHHALGGPSFSKSLRSTFGRCDFLLRSPSSSKACGAWFSCCGPSRRQRRPRRRRVMHFVLRSRGLLRTVSRSLKRRVGLADQRTTRY